MSEWQPIETVPKDGTRVLLYGPSIGIVAVSWQIGTFNGMGSWKVDMTGVNRNQATHWMALPKPPIEANAQLSE